MPPRVATRIVRLRQPRLTAQTERMQLLTYPMALAQHGATVPLIQSRQHPSHTTVSSAAAPRAGQRAPSSAPLAQAETSMMDGPAEQGDAHSWFDHHRNLPVPRRWVRDADELCIASIHRSNNINRINSYVATYKFDDPQWRPLLLPEVHVLPKAPVLEQADRVYGGTGAAAAAAAGVAASSASSSDSAPPSQPPPASASSSDQAPAFDVFIDYNKLTTLELISRHANYALRHLVQKGHAMYIVNFAQHSIVQMRGLVEASYVSCAYGIRGERLRTHIIHTGPVDVRDVIEIDPQTHNVNFNFKKPHVRRGVVAVSTVEGYGTWFQRKPMLWQRTRRIGALQSQMGSYDYQLCDPAEVGRLRSYEVSLLAPHVRLIGAQGGAEAVALVASSQVAQNERLYMGQFEAPVLTAIDAVQQLAHRTALHHQLLRPAVEEKEEESAEAHEHDDAATTAAYEDPLLREWRRLAGMERLLPVSWVTRTPPPYVPLESDLPFRIQVSRPAVIRADERRGPGAAAAVVFPTGGAVGSPFVRGVPLSLYEYVIHQGVDHYIFDDAPSARPLKWWNQKSNMPYNGYMYAMRSGLLDFVEPAEIIANPLAPPSSGKSARHRRSRRSRRSGTAVSRPSASSTSASTAAATATETEADSPPMQLSLSGEVLSAGADALVGHDEAARQAASLEWAEAGHDAAVSDRPALHTLVSPSSTARRRLRRYATRGVGAGEEASEGRSAVRAAAVGAAAPLSSPSSPLPLEERAGVLLQRQMRLRRLRRHKNRNAGDRQKKSKEDAMDSTDSTSNLDSSHGRGSNGL